MFKPLISVMVKESTKSEQPPREGVILLSVVTRVLVATVLYFSKVVLIDRYPPDFVF